MVCEMHSTPRSMNNADTDIHSAEVEGSTEVEHMPASDSPIVLQSEVVQPTLVSRWLARLLLAACLMLGSEILLWNNPLNRPASEWILLIFGYVGLAAFLLDIMVRHKVRDLMGLMTVSGVYGLLNALLLNPSETLFDVPRTLVTRATGAHTLLGLEMLVLFLALTGGGGKRRGARRLRWTLIGGAAVVGLAWGAWVRWSPEQTDITYALTPYPTMLLVGVVGVLIVAVLTLINFRGSAALSPQHLLLTLREGALVGLTLTLIAFLRLIQNAYVSGVALFLVSILLALCAAIIWFRRNTRHPMLLTDHFPMRPPPWIWLILAAAVLFWTAVFAYNVPRIGTPSFDQGVFVAAGFALYGLAWLPTVSLILGARAYIRQVQAKPM